MSTDTPKPKLTAKQNAYYNQRISGETPSDAYRAVYSIKNMSDNSIYVEASRLESHPKLSPMLKDFFSRQRESVEEKAIVTKEYVLTKLIEVAERCMQTEAVMTSNGEEMQETGEYKFEHAGANKALELLGKSIALFTDKKEINPGEGVSFNMSFKAAKDGE